MITTFDKYFISNFFFSFSLVLILLTLYLLIISKNPINTIIWLIIFFFEISFIFIFCGADYIAVLFLMLYAGAISIILLFVVMLLDMKSLVLEKEKSSKILSSIYILYILWVIFLIIKQFLVNINSFMPRVQYIDWFALWNERTNIEVIGGVLYEFYLLQFLVMGVFLFLIMVLIISLIINYNFLSKKQNLSEQLQKINTIRFNE